MQKGKKYAVITGASMGLGRCFAHEIAKRGINPILISLPGEGLEEVASEVKAYGVDPHIYETDMTRKRNIFQLSDWINKNFDISILINNAGRGGTRSFLGCDAGYIDDIIQLNITATSLIIHQLLPNLIRQDKAYILNVSSMAAFSPIGYKTVYPASKKFIQYLTQGLNAELSETGVQVSVVHPGPMWTNEEVIRRINMQGKLGRFCCMTPEKVAQCSLDGMIKGRVVILPGFRNRLSWLILKSVPTPVRLPIMTKVIYREISSQTK